MSEELKVTPDDLDKFATTIKDLSAQAGRAKDYASSYLNIDAEQGRIYASANELVDEIQKNLRANYEKLAALCDSASSELTKSAQMYRTTDLEAAKRQDALYPGAER
ncbi:type VII secretion target [Nocardia xishanensis]|uniref:type VII secretion target n=1 Tax=Nocardia xishanensis TaxID=238964 RepID=UPI000A00E3F5|nr:type VII secretion target [Nocardia xishanensis]